LLCVIVVITRMVEALVYGMKVLEHQWAKELHNGRLFLYDLNFLCSCAWVPFICTEITTKDLLFCEMYHILEYDKSPSTIYSACLWPPIPKFDKLQCDVFPCQWS
jgi:hypothetical protein